MGADLYIPTLFDANREKYQPQFEAAIARRDAMLQRHAAEPAGAALREAQAAVMEAHEAMYAEGYFRDSYNATSVLCALGLSWWRDVIPMCEDGFLSPRQAQGLAKLLRETPVPEPAVCVERMGPLAVVDDGEDSPGAWRRYFVEKRERLIAFLEKAVELDVPIRASL